MIKAIVDIPFDAENSKEPFGKRWGGQVIEVTEDDLKELRAGKLLALDIMNEYVTYLKLGQSNNKQHD